MSLDFPLFSLKFLDFPMRQKGQRTENNKKKQKSEKSNKKKRKCKGEDEERNG